MGDAIHKSKVYYAAYTLVNLLFIIKYSLRISTAVCVAASCAYTAVLWLIFYNNEKIGRHISLKKIIIIFVVYLALSFVVQCSINPYSLNVDRWSAINNFLQYLFQGKYPYMAQTHLGGYGSPFPIWQIVHIPFYLMHNVGLSFFAAIALFVYCIKKYINGDTVSKVIICIILSPAFAYEALVRSDLMANFIIVATIIIIFFYKRICLEKNFILIAFACGLLMSTRLSAVLPIGVLILTDWWKQGLLKKISLPIIVLFVFALTFLPLFLWDGNNLLFFQYNPFILQSRQLHSFDLISIAILFFYLSYNWTKGNTIENKFAMLTENISLLLLVSVAIVFAHNMVLSTNYNLFSSAYDITYFDMSLPFIILSIASFRTKTSN